MKERKIYKITIETPLGAMLASGEDDKITGLWFTDQKNFPLNTDNWISKADYYVFMSLKAWLKEYFTGKRPAVRIPIAIEGSDFQKAVYKVLMDIPYGKTSTYGAVGKQVTSSGQTASSQAVGVALEKNPISLLIPCHRVIGADGNLTDYTGGVDRKELLLKLEKAI